MERKFLILKTRSMK